MPYGPYYYRRSAADNDGGVTGKEKGKRQNKVKRQKEGKDFDIRF